MKYVVAQNTSNLQLCNNNDMMIINHRHVDNQFEYCIEKNKKIIWMRESDINSSNKLISEYWYKLGINNKKKSSVFVGAFDDLDKNKDLDTHNTKKRKCNDGNMITTISYDIFDDGVDDIVNDIEDIEDIIDDKVIKFDDKMVKDKKGKVVDSHIQEIENILECKKKKGVNNYLIKWVGSKVPTWITEKDFFERDALNEFHEYEKLRNNSNNDKHRAYIYCRTSKRNNEREVSLHDQERVCMEFAKKNNISVIGVFRDNGTSAKNMEKQFALNHIAGIIKKGECLLFYDVTRFSRSMHQAIEKLEYLREEVGALAHSVHDRMTWNNIASNRHNFRQILSTSQLHSEIVSEKVMSSLEYKRERGDHVGYVPYGYRTEYIEGVKTLVKNETEFKVIQYIFEKARDIRMEKLLLQKTNKKRKINDIDQPDDQSQVTQKQVKVQDFCGNDYKKITELVNMKYVNRRNKPFTVQYIKKLLLEWKNKI